MRHPLTAFRVATAIGLLLASLPAPVLSRVSPSHTVKNQVASFAASTQETKTIPFANFTAKVEVEATEFEVDGTFTLSGESNGINLFKESVTVRVGEFSANIPAGSFKQEAKGKLKFKSAINGVDWTVVFRTLGKNAFDFKAEGEGAKRIGKLKPEDVRLTIGDDGGSAKAQ